MENNLCVVSERFDAPKSVKKRQNDVFDLKSARVRQFWKIALLGVISGQNHQILSQKFDDFTSKLT